MLDFLRHFFGERHSTIPARVLGSIECYVGVSHQFIR